MNTMVDSGKQSSLLYFYAGTYTIIENGKLSWKYHLLTLKVLVTTIDALGHFETG